MYIYGGALGAIVFSKAGYAACSHIDLGTPCLAEYKLNLLAAVRGELIEGLAEILEPDHTPIIIRLGVFSF